MMQYNVKNIKYGCSKRIIGDLEIFKSKDATEWEQMYAVIINKKYAKNTRKFSTTIVGSPIENGTKASIYVVPRIRGGPGYLSVPLIGVNKDNVQYCPISKGFSMQNVSSFTLGPIVGEGLCLVNAAFSKSITIAHIEGGGCLDLKRKNFWKRARKPTRIISLVDNEHISVDGDIYDTHTWLKNNENLWYEQWELWRKHVALCSLGDFHWSDKMGDVISYKKGKNYLNFVQWKKKCYIKPSYELLPNTDVYKFLDKVYNKHNISLGLVHPKGRTEYGEYPVTYDFIRNMYDSCDIMCCQPYVIVGKLLNVPIYE